MTEDNPFPSEWGPSPDETGIWQLPDENEPTWPGFENEPTNPFGVPHPDDTSIIEVPDLSWPEGPEPSVIVDPEELGLPNPEGEAETFNWEDITEPEGEAETFNWEDLGLAGEETAEGEAAAVEATEALEATDIGLGVEEGIEAGEIAVEAAEGIELIEILELAPLLLL